MQIIVVGGGKMGTHLAGRLQADGEAVTIIEARQGDAERVRRVRPDCTVVCGNASDPQILERAGVRMADVVVAVTGEDEVNLVISMLAKMEFAVPRVVARVNDPRNAWMFTPANGVDVGVNQADIMARFVLEGMNLRDVYTLMRLGRGDHSIVQANVGAGSQVDGSALRDIIFPDQTIVIAVDRKGDITVPNGDTVLQADDEAILFTNGDGRDAIRRLFA